MEKPVKEEEPAVYQIYDNPLYISGILSRICDNLDNIRDVSALSFTCKFILQNVNPLERFIPPHQMVHINKIMRRLDQGNKFFLDNSIPGSGKTYTTCALARKLRLPLYVISPKSVIGSWKEVAYRFSVPLCIVTYDKFRNEYQANPDLLNEKINNGHLFVFDECQKLKNATNQFKAGLNLTNKVNFRENGKSKIAFLSATYSDKPEQMVNFCKLFGYIIRDKLARQDIQRGYILEGLDDLLTRSNIPDKKQMEYTREFQRNRSLTKNHMIVADIFEKYIKPEICFSMPPPQIDAEYDTKNGFYALDKESADKVQEAISRYQAGLQNNNQAAGLAHFTHAGRLSELGKITITYKLAEKVLLSNPKAKVIIACFYLHTMKEFELIFKNYQCLVLNGATKNRDDLLLKFNENPSYRILICNMTISALGISLHDTIGDSPRYSFILPNHHIINMHQIAYRIYRLGTKSNATVRYIYGLDQGDEVRLLTSIASKSEHMRKMTHDELKDVKFPNEYESVYEENE